jgi:hypothetical protein
MDTFNLAAKSGAWTATLDIKNVRKVTHSRMRTYFVRLTITTKSGLVSVIDAEEDIYNTFDPESWSRLCALRAGNMEDVSISERVKQMY